MDNAAEFPGESFCPELKDWQTRGPPHPLSGGFLLLLPEGCETRKQAFSHWFHSPSIHFPFYKKSQTELQI